MLHAFFLDAAQSIPATWQDWALGGGVGVLKGEYVLPPLFKEGREWVLHPLFSTFFIEKLDPPRGGDPFPRDALRIPATHS